MDNEKHRTGDSSPSEQENGHSYDSAHVEKRRGSASSGRHMNDPSYVDHRADDDRADNAKGRNADTYGSKYWLSWRYLGTLFAIGMAFMGGIGGFGLIAPVLTGACLPSDSLP